MAPLLGTLACYPSRPAKWRWMLSRTGNVSDVSALTTNFNQNVRKVLNEFQTQLSRNDISQGERQLIEQARDAIRAGRFERTVTNANLNSSATTSGVSARLRGMRIKFLDVMRPPPRPMPPPQL